MVPKLLASVAMRQILSILIISVMHGWSMLTVLGRSLKVEIIFWQLQEAFLAFLLVNDFLTCSKFDGRITLTNGIISTGLSTLKEMRRRDSVFIR